MLQFNKFIGKNYALEINSLSVYETLLIPYGFRIAISPKQIFLKLSMIIDIDINIRWKGDHKGFFLIITTPGLELLDFGFYNIHHED